MVLQRLTPGSKATALAGTVPAVAAAPVVLKAETATVAGDSRVAASRPYLDRGEDLVRSAFRARGLALAAFPGQEVRGLSALVGRGLVTPAELASLGDRLGREPRALAALLDAKRPGFMASIGRERGLAVEDGANRWTVQELANLDYVLSELPESFMRVVRNGPAFRRDGESERFGGLYNPFTNRAMLFDRASTPADASLAEVKAREADLRGTMLQELGHAWQIRSASRANPGVWGVLTGILGIVWQKPDFLSEWARISGWTVKPAWSLASLFGERATPNLGNGSTAMTDVSFSLFGKQIRLGNLTDLEYDPAKKETFVSEYARTDPYEDFADSVIAYFADPEVLRRRSPEKYAFMRDRVMGGKEYMNAYGMFS